MHVHLRQNLLIRRWRGEDETLLAKELDQGRQFGKGSDALNVFAGEYDLLQHVITPPKEKLGNYVARRAYRVALHGLCTMATKPSKSGR